MTPTYAGLVSTITGIISLIVPVLFSLLFIYLIWKIIDSWIINAGDPTKLEEGRRYAVTAVIALFVMVSVWGIVALIKTSIF